MQYNTCLLMSCSRRKRLWLTRVSPSVKREALRVMVRAKNTRRGKQNMKSRKNLKTAIDCNIPSKEKSTHLVEVVDHQDHTKNKDRCLRCGRKLKNPQARELGYGPICYAKLQKENSCKLF